MHSDCETVRERLSVAEYPATFCACADPRQDAFLVKPQSCLHITLAMGCLQDLCFRFAPRMEISSRSRSPLFFCLLKLYGTVGLATQHIHILDPHRSMKKHLILGGIRGTLKGEPLLNPLLALLTRDLIQRVYICKGPPNPIPYLTKLSSRDGVRWLLVWRDNGNAALTTHCLAASGSVPD